MMKNRRELLKLTAAAALGITAAPVLALSNAASVPVANGNKKKKTTLKHTQRIVNNTSPQFNATLDAFFPGVGANGVFNAKLRKYAVAIVNNSTVPVLGYTVCWRSYSGGRFVERHRKRLMKRPSMQLKKRALTTETALLAAGDALLVTPLFVMRSSVYRHKMAAAPAGKTVLSSQRFKFNASRMPEATGFVQRSGDATIRIKIEGVVFADQVLGTKRKQLANYVRNQVNAEHDEASKLYASSIDAHGALDLSLLHRNIERSLFVGKQNADPAVAAYVAARARFARRVQFLANSAPAVRVVRTLARVAAVPKATLR